MIVSRRGFLCCCRRWFDKGRGGGTCRVTILDVPFSLHTPPTVFVKIT